MLSINERASLHLCALRTWFRIVEYTFGSVKLINSRFCLIVMRELGNLDIDPESLNACKQSAYSRQRNRDPNNTQKRRRRRRRWFAIFNAAFSVSERERAHTLWFSFEWAWSWLMHAWIIYSGVWYSKAKALLGMDVDWGECHGLECS